jgi:toxin ParE1/3/4
VPTLVFSSRARADLLEIAQYSEQRWGRRQAVKYVEEIRTCCLRLTEDPILGRPFGPERPDIFRKEQGSHVVFFRRDSTRMRVIRILHKRMVPKRHLS